MNPAVGSFAARRGRAKHCSFFARGPSKVAIVQLCSSGAEDGISLPERLVLPARDGKRESSGVIRGGDGGGRRGGKNSQPLGKGKGQALRVTTSSRTGCRRGSDTGRKRRGMAAPAHRETWGFMITGGMTMRSGSLHATAGKRAYRCGYRHAPNLKSRQYCATIEGRKSLECSLRKASCWIGKRV